MAPLLASADSSVIKLWNCGYNKDNAKGNLLFQLRNTFSPFDSSHNISCIEWSQDSTKLVIGTIEGEIILIDFENSTTNKILIGKEKIYSVRFFQKSKYLLISGNKKIIRWDIKNKKFLNSLAGNKTSAIVLISTNPEETQIAAGSSDGSVLLYNFESGTKKLLKNNNKQATNCIEFSKQKTHSLATAGDDGNIYIYSIRQSNRPSTILENVHYAPIQSIQFDPKDKNIIFSVGLDKRIVISSIQDKKPLMVFETPYALNHVTTNPEGNVLACSTETGEILFYDIRFKRLVGTIPAHENQPIKGLLFQYTKVSPAILKQMSKIPVNSVDSKDTSNIDSLLNAKIENNNNNNDNNTNNNTSVMSIFSPLKNEDEIKENNNPSTTLKNNIEKTTKLISNEIKYSIPTANHSMNKRSSISSLSLNKKSNESFDFNQNSMDLQEQINRMSPTISPSPAGSGSGSNYFTNHSRRGSASSINSFLSNTESINKQYQRQKRIEQLRQQLKSNSNTSMNDSLTAHLTKDKTSNDSISLSSSFNSNKSASLVNMKPESDKDKMSPTSSNTFSNAKLFSLEKHNSFSNIKSHTSNLTGLVSSLKRSQSLVDKSKTKQQQKLSMSPNLSNASFLTHDSTINNNSNIATKGSIKNIRRPSTASFRSTSDIDIDMDVGSPSLSSVASPYTSHSRLGPKNLYTSSSSQAISLSEDLAITNKINSLSASLSSSSLKQSQLQSFFKSKIGDDSEPILGQPTPHSNASEFIKPPPQQPKITSMPPRSSPSPSPSPSPFMTSPFSSTFNMPMAMDGLNFDNPMYHPLVHSYTEDQLSQNSSDGGYNSTIKMDNDKLPTTTTNYNNIFATGLGYGSTSNNNKGVLPYIEGDSIISDTSTITSTMVKKRSSHHVQPFHPSPPVITSSLQLPLPKMNSINDFLQQQEFRNQALLTQNEETINDNPYTSVPTTNFSGTNVNNTFSQGNVKGLEGDYISVEDVQALATHSIPHKMLLQALEKSVESIRDDFQEDITNIHLEIIRQFHIQKIEFETMFHQYSVIDNIQKEINYLREENKRLKNFQPHTN
ncbi:hypothetical protein BCR36DRAFT_588070 [Piromyces finnis]|uniref:Uncharacterized protein n=1 Tax=Piromyces finnis TaxID=1754191 RepID=A0A1Y1UTN0_9FUNG|nr:hypothetical protein BCR36DRAFT_588070 [Piromyces finnis]|eukprot:ORX41378.1 hypothetical protein BCR36DRAFT_588070 [Piromyces finnis]